MGCHGLNVTAFYSSAVMPNLDGRYEQNGGQHREQHTTRHHAKQQPADHRADNRTRGHDEQESTVAAKNRKALVPAVAGEPDEHGRQAHGKRQASSELDVGSEQQHQRWNEQLTPGQAEQRGHDADAEPGDDASDELRRSNEQGLASWPNTSTPAMATRRTAITR
jgi:hypothetical protein